MRTSWVAEAESHLQFARALVLQTADPLNTVRLELKAVKEKVCPPLRAYILGWFFGVYTYLFPL